MRTLLAAAAACLTLPVCLVRLGAGQSPAPQGMRPLLSTSIRMTDVTAEAGLRFVHTSGRTERHYYAEIMSGGGCFLDYNGDGWQDIFLVQGAPLPLGKNGPAPSDVLYRNNQNGTFTDATREAGLTDARYGLGCAVGDVDNDGDSDLFVTNLDGPMLYRNGGKGKFTDISAKSGIDAPGLSTSAAFVDYDRDGWPDLLVARYMDYSIERDKLCLKGTVPIYCTPLMFPATASRLYRNNRNGTFTDVSLKAGIAGSVARALGIATADFNGDDWIDLFLASDQTPNLLFLNRGDGTFREDAHAAGVAVNSMGLALGGMGVDAGDYDNDGFTDLFITNFEYQTNSLYRNRGDGTFADESRSSGIHQISLFYVGWGTRFVDLNRDGRRDLFVVNGHVDDTADDRFGNAASPLRTKLMQRGSRDGFSQRAHIYFNQGGGKFLDVSPAAGDFFWRKQVARGAVFGDYDNDGDVDALIVNNNEPATLLRNESEPAAPWVRIELQGDGCNRDALGSRVRVTSGTLTQTEFVRSGGSYLADHDRRLMFALPADGQGRAEIRWPCGATETLTVRGGESIKVREHGCLLNKKRPAVGPDVVRARTR